jgi:hypothetical protein
MNNQERRSKIKNLHQQIDPLSENLFIKSLERATNAKLYNDTGDDADRISYEKSNRSYNEISERLAPLLSEVLTYKVPYVISYSVIVSSADGPLIGSFEQEVLLSTYCDIDTTLQPLDDFDEDVIYLKNELSRYLGEAFNRFTLLNIKLLK